MGSAGVRWKLILLPRWLCVLLRTAGMWVGFFVFVAILGLGGPTGIAANPARDFSPRLAHALLPIPGK
jgi:glycerol uptake facilitator protein